MKQKKDTEKRNNASLKKNNKKINSVQKVLNKKTNFKVYELLIMMLLVSVVSIFLTIVIMNETKYESNAKNIALYEDNNLNEFKEVYDTLNSSYYKKTNKQKLIEGAINGMLESLDDVHTSYFTAEETNSFNDEMSGVYEGIGAEIAINSEGKPIIFSVFKDSPANEAGLKYNDIIYEVNGKKVEGMSTTEIVSIIKDRETSVAKMKVIRGEEEITVEMKKRIINIESVESKIFKENDKKIGYIVINNFANNTYSQFKSNLESLESKNISALIIDVRNNTGGYLHSVSNMLDILLPQGKTMYQISDRKSTQKFISKSAESRNYPIAVLVNESSASASEILAVSLKEVNNAEIIGKTTYGKGTVQTTKQLSNGTMFKYTIQKWLSPNSNWIDKKGVSPTVEVELSVEYAKNPVEENDTQLKTAIEVMSKKK